MCEDHNWDLKDQILLANERKDNVVQGKRPTQQGGAEDGRPIKQRLDNIEDAAGTGCKWRWTLWTQSFTTLIQRNERKHSEYNLVANNQKR